MKKATKPLRLTPPILGAWIIGLLGGVGIGVGAHFLHDRPEIDPILTVLTKWPTPLLHGLGGGLGLVVLFSLSRLPFRRLSLPYKTEMRREYLQNLLHQCGEQFGRRTVADDPARAVSRLADLARSRLSDDWSLASIAGVLLGFGWLGLFLKSNLDAFPQPRDAGWWLLVGFAESAFVLVGSVLIWVLSRVRLRAWEAEARRAIVQSAEEQRSVTPAVAAPQAISPTPTPVKPPEPARVRTRTTGPLPMDD